jgi:hypothetical protein
MNLNDEIVILPFLSTSINQYAALEFTDRTLDTICMWEINIPSGQILPYIHNGSLPSTIAFKSTNKEEHEVLFPTHARLKFVKRRTEQFERVKHDGSIKTQTLTIYGFDLVGFTDIEPNFWKNVRKNLVGEENRNNSSNKRRRGGTRKHKKIKNRRNEIKRRLQSASNSSSA